MRFTDGTDWWLYKSSKAVYSLGTALCYRREWWEQTPFSFANIGEDNTMVEAAQRAGQIVSEDAGELMYATIHPGNTSPRSITDAWKKL